MSAAEKDGQEAVVQHLRDVCIQLTRSVLPLLTEWRALMLQAAEQLALPANASIYSACLTTAQRDCVHPQSIAAAAGRLSALCEQIDNAVNVKCKKVLHP